MDKNKRGRPRQFGGAINVRLPRVVEIRIHSEAESTGRSIADVVRAALQRDFETNEADPQN